MTNPTITATSGNNFLYSGSKVLTFYDVTLENIGKTAGAIDMPMPTMDSDDKIVMDLMGASRTITVEGTVTSEQIGAANLYKYARDIVGLASSGYNTLINGSQGSTTYTYVPESLNRGGSGATIAVCVTEASIKSNGGNPNELSYSVTMIEAGTLI